MSGLETLRQLRQIRSVADLPVIMVTAKDESDDVVEALDLGRQRLRHQADRFRGRAGADSSAGHDPARRPADRSAESRAVHGSARAPADAAVRSRGARRSPCCSSTSIASRSSTTAWATRPATSCWSRSRNGSKARCARRIRWPASRASHTLARMGGDEFTVLLDGIGDSDARAARSPNRLRAAVAQPIPAAGAGSRHVGQRRPGRQRRPLPARGGHGPRRGYRDVPREGAGQGALRGLRHVDARRGGGAAGAGTGSSPARSNGTSWRSTTSRSSRCRRRGSPASKRCCAGIIRARGLVLPAEFIPIAEETGLIVPIGTWVLHEACRQLDAGSRSSRPRRDLVVNVNLSARQCMHPDLLRGRPPHSRRHRRARRRGSSSRSPKASSWKTPKSSANVLRELRALGVQLGLDDFGMGYSALSYLQQFPFQTIKIDRAFVSGMEERRQHRDHSRDRGAGRGPGDGRDGRRDRDRWTRWTAAASSSCEFGQGYYFNKPLTSRGRARRCFSRARHGEPVTLRGREACLVAR